MAEQFARVEILTDIDVPQGAWGWLDVIALEGEPPHRRIETPKDAETIVYWQDEKPAAIVLNLRDQFNRSIQYRFDLRASVDAGEVRKEAIEAICRAICALEGKDPDEFVQAGDPLGNPADYPAWMLCQPAARHILTLLSPTILVGDGPTGADIAQVGTFAEGVEAAAKVADAEAAKARHPAAVGSSMKIATAIRALASGEG